MVWGEIEMDVAMAARLVQVMATEIGKLRAGVGLPAMLTFASISRDPEQTPDGIAKARGVTPATVRRHMARLSELVERYADPHDPRLQRVRLTERGREAWEDLAAAFDDVLRMNGHGTTIGEEWGFCGGE